MIAEYLETIAKFKEHVKIQADPPLVIYDG